MERQGCNIIDGLKRNGYRTVGTGAVGWFDRSSETAKHLTEDFDEFFFAGDRQSVAGQLAWLEARMSASQRNFIFINIGETHVPYYHKAAPWDSSFNPCVPFGKANDASESRRRQLSCLEFVDGQLAGLVTAFRCATTLICADHGDCWGEDGLWEHRIHHIRVLEVPLLLRRGEAITDSAPHRNRDDSHDA